MLTNDVVLPDLRWIDHKRQLLASEGMTKPPYRVPSMRSILARRWNGLNVVSTFSGCGGSCLGYRMAGFRVLWANEFIPAARDTYRANFPRTTLDPRDIRAIEPHEVLGAIGLAEGEIDLLDGSPPCASFSVAGGREKGWGTVRKYSDTKQRVDDLFFEFARLLRGLQPKVFVAENVPGLTIGVSRPIFREVLDTLAGCGYVVSAKVLDAQWLGVPQARRRLIIQGVRADLGRDPAFPAPLPYRYGVREAIPQVNRIKVGTSPAGGSISDLRDDQFWSSADRPHRTIVQSDSRAGLMAGRSSGGWIQDESGETRRLTIAELRRVCGFPDDFALTGTYARRWERLGRAVPPVMMGHIAATIRDEVLSCK